MHSTVYRVGRGLLQYILTISGIGVVSSALNLICWKNETVIGAVTDIKLCYYESGSWAMGLLIELPQ
jgi:hypothetical protein